MSITISRHAGDGEYFISDSPGPVPRGTYDPEKARHFANVPEIREWFESLSAHGRFVLFAACAYRINWKPRRLAGAVELDEESAARLDEANPPFGSGRF